MANDPKRDWGHWLRLHRPMFEGEEWQILFDLLQAGGAPCPTVAYRIRREHPDAPWFNGITRWEGARWTSQAGQARTYQSPKGASHAAREAQRAVGETLTVVPFCRLQAAAVPLDQAP